MLKGSHKIFLHKLKWYIYIKLSSFFDFAFFNICFSIFTKKKQLPCNGLKIIVYIGELMAPRIARLSKWVRRTGEFKTILVCSKKGFIDKFCNQEFDEIYLFRNEWHLKILLNKINNIYIVHGFAPKSYFPDIARQFVKAPYIHDMQDAFSLYYSNNPDIDWLKKELPHERNCLAQAQGVIGQSMEPNIGFRKFNIKKKPKTLFFGLYCDDDVIVGDNKTLNIQDIHIAYAGGVAGSFRDPHIYGNIQFQSLIKKITDQKINFHIYPSPSNIPADYEEYYNTAKQNKYFHFHEPVSQNELAAELSQYHFGILPFFKELSEQSPLKLKYATTLKLFNYIEAGLPVIVSSDLGYQSWIISRYLCGITVSLQEINQLSKKISAINYSDMVSHVQRTALKLSISKNIKRIISFYTTLQN